ncbi:MAG: glucose 1-dehydrogenase [Candidatus Binatia bacterium]|nr:glucose 1-dehydrogenase [Candidatus Binatia bacterium]
MSAPGLDPLAAFRLDDRVAVVTGASSGFGARFARILAAAGAKVIVTARRADRLEQLVSEIDGATAIPCDLTVPSEAERLAQEALALHGHVDVLINNAGATDGPARAQSESLDEFRRVVDINLNAVFHLSRLLAPSMIERGRGVVVNVASVHGFVASAPNTQAAYVASKGAVVALTKELALQWAKKGVRVNAIAPGYFETEITADMFADERSLSWIQRNTPLGRPGEIHELDGALLFLASDASSYVTGTTFLVDGGWTAR